MEMRFFAPSMAASISGKASSPLVRSFTLLSVLAVVPVTESMTRENSSVPTASAWGIISKAVRIKLFGRIDMCVQPAAETSSRRSPVHATGRIPNKERIQLCTRFCEIASNIAGSEIRYDRSKNYAHTIMIG